MTRTVLDALNDYEGENLWEDVIYTLDYDEAATNAVDSGDGRDVVIGGVHYHYDQTVSEWKVA